MTAPVRCRSFAIVIQSLPVELRDAVCVFYLVLRALDTVEDDMAIAVDVKLPILRSFHEHIYDRCCCRYHNDPASSRAWELPSLQLRIAAAGPGK